VTALLADPAETRVHGLLDRLREAEADLRRSYARVLSVVAELDAENAGAVAGFGSTARLLAGVLNLSKGEAKARVEQAGLLIPRRSLTGEVLAPRLPATATELAAGAIGPGQLRVITSIMGRIPSTADPDAVELVEQSLASSACRFDPAALARIGERLLGYLNPDGPEPSEQPEQTRELQVRTGSDGTVSLSGRLDPEGGARVLEVLSSLNGRRPPVDGVPDLRSPARRNADALVEAMSSLLDEGNLPSRGAQRPHLVLTMKLTDLIEGLGSAVLDTGGRIPLPRPAVWPAMPALCPWCWVPIRCRWMSDANNGWPPRRCATRWANVTKAVHFQVAIARPVIAMPTTSYRGWTADRRN
jgi:hypothetical protein